MQRAGVRRLCVISGAPAWCLTQADAWRARLAGDWMTVSDDASLTGELRCAPAALRNLLGQEFRHAIFDARSDFHAEAFAALAGTLCAGSWLLLLLPEWERWPQHIDRDSLRWADVEQAIATPHFVCHLQTTLLADARVVLQRQNQPLRALPLSGLPEWRCQAPQQQQAILQQLLNIEAGAAVLTAARGRGKSALAGMLAKQQGNCLVTAPAKVSTAVLARFAGEKFHFMAPDAILACNDSQPFDWLIVDEAAAIPAPLLQQLVARFPRVLLTTTVQGYEGTGRGFMLKFCAGLARVRYFTLDEPIRWARQDPLETLVDQALLFEDAALPRAARGNRISRCEQQAWLTQPERLAAAYRLLASAHYRTSPLDLRRMMDAPGMQFWLAGEAPALQGALWLVEEGGLSAALAQAVWAGTRRPRGNLVAQSLAAHAGFPSAATLRSRRISRIAVAAEQRRQGTGQALVEAAVASAQGCDYLSVSFGYTEALRAFWRACGFSLVRIGSQREASSGCYAAMAIRALSPEGDALLRLATQRLARDWPLLRQQVSLALSFPSSQDERFNDDDWLEAAGFAWALRPFEASYAALFRLIACSPQPLPALSARIIQKQTANDVAARFGLSGRKTLIRQLRKEAAQALTALDVGRAESLQKQIAALR